MASDPWTMTIMGLATGAQLYGQKRQREAALEAEQRQVDEHNARVEAERQARLAQYEQILRANQAQQAIADRAGGALRQAITDEFGNLRQTLSRREDDNRAKLEAVIERPRRDADPAAEAGSARRVGSDVQGRISEHFTERGEKAYTDTVDRSKRIARQQATIDAYGRIPQDNQAAYGRTGFAVEPYTRERASQAAADRLRIQKAGYLPPETLEFIDASDPLGQVLEGLGQGLFQYGLYRGMSGPLGPTTTSGAGGGVGPVRTFTRGG